MTDGVATRVADGVARSAALLIGIVSWPLLLKANLAIFRTLAVMCPGGGGVPDDRFWGFHPLDLGFRGFYRKLGRDFRRCGARGIAWDDGFGSPLAARFYNSPFSYQLLDRLGDRRLLLIGYVVLIGVTFALAWHGFGPWAGLAIAVAVGGSPLVVLAFTHRGKPEVVWYGPGLLAVMLGMSGHELLAALAWSVVAWANLPAAVTLGLLAGPPMLVAGILNGVASTLVLGALPGALVAGWRLLPALEYRFLRRVVDGQKKVARGVSPPDADDLFVAIVHGGAVLLAAPDPVGLTAALTGAVLYWFNRNVVYLNDVQCFDLGLLTVSASLVFVSGSFLSLLVLLVFVHRLRPGTPWRFPIQDWEHRRSIEGKGWAGVLDGLVGALRAFPELTAYHLPRSPSLQRFLDAMEDGSRFVLERSADPIGTRNLTDYLEIVLPERRVENITELYTDYLEPVLAENVLSRLSIGEMGAVGIREACGLLGARYFIAISASTAETLVAEAGYIRVASLDTSELDETDRMALRLPLMTFHLLRHPDPDCAIVTPCCRWERQGNVITIDACRGTQYDVRYSFDSHIVAAQGGVELPVKVHVPWLEAPTRFMRVEAIVDGPLTLTYAYRVRLPFRTSKSADRKHSRAAA